MTATLGAGALPPRVPQLPPNAWRAICARILRACGWRLVGELPDQARLVLIAAPHSSWWDGVWGLLFKVALGVDVAFMAKRELFFGPLGWILRRLGGIAIERSATHGLVEQMIERFAARERFWLGIAPEGTRRSVTRWKTGFWQIAQRAHVPILPVYFDYPSKTIGIGALFVPSADIDADLDALRAVYRPFRGKHHNA